VRLVGRDCRSLVKFASLAASELAAPGHLALTGEQCEWAGAPPCSHIRLQRLTRSQRELILEAAQAQQANGSRTAGPGGSRATVAGMLGKAGGAAAAAAAAGNGASQQQQQKLEQKQQQLDAADQLQQQVGAGAEWLRGPSEAALQHLLPVLGFTPRSLLQSWGAPRPGGLLVCGPAGSGKSAVLAAAASALRRHPECLTYTVTLSCREVSAEGASQAQAQILPKVMWRGLEWVLVGGDSSLSGSLLCDAPSR
jgi:DNA replication protein DnaC